MNHPLLPQHGLILVSLRQYPLHLPESLVVEAGGVNMAAHQVRIEFSGEAYRSIHRIIRVFRIIHRYENISVHFIFSVSF
jgi:hypothetical protein